MKKKLVIICSVLFASLLLSLTSCAEFLNFENPLTGGEDKPCEHKWQDATCTEPKICELCGETKGTPRGHEWEEGICTDPKVCGVCGEENDDVFEHDYTQEIKTPATCTTSGTKRFVCVECDYSYTESYSLPVYEANKIYERAQPSVGEIVTYDGSGKGVALGTGFVYSSDGKIITNYHVINGAHSAEITLNGKDYDVESVLAYNVDLDIAVLKIDAAGLVTLPICASAHEVGSPVYAIGSSKGLTGTFSQGIITYASRKVNGITCVQHDAAISPGNSGGPLINKFGEVIGINTMTIKNSQNLNFAISVKELDNLSYENVYTLAEVYELEADALAKLGALATREGELNEEEDGYSLMLGRHYSQELSGNYAILIIFYSTDKELWLIIRGTSDMAAIVIDELDGTYEWVYYYEAEDFVMSGELDAATYSRGAVLSYDYSSSPSSSSNFVLVASCMVEELCSYMNEDFAVAEVTAEDLGFENF